METKDLYSEFCKMLIKNTEDDINRWKDIPCFYIRRSNILKMTVLPKVICRLNTNPIKLPVGFFIELEQKILKFVQRHKRPPK